MVIGGKTRVKETARKIKIIVILDNIKMDLVGMVF
jgi:hypothetical protein